MVNETMAKRLRLSVSATNMTESMAVAIFSKVADMKSRGEVVNGALCVGQPDFPPPPEAIRATGEASEKGLTTYTGVSGTLELRVAICEYLETHKKLKYTPDEVLVSCGAKQAIYEVLLVLCQAGDEVIVPSPCWTSYPEMVRLSGASPVILETRSDQGYAIDAAALAAVITPATRMLVICNPSNPTGCVMTRPQLEAIAEVLRRPEHQHVYVLADEIYERISYDVEHVAFATLDEMWDRTLTINGFSKAFAMTGYRLGYMAAPKPIVKAAATLQGQITSCASSIAQHAGIAALKSPVRYIDEKVEELKRKRDHALQCLLKIPMVTCPVPAGAFYLLPDVSAYFGRKTPSGDSINDSQALSMHLLDTYKVALVPGIAFLAPKCVRLSYAAPLASIEDAIEKLSICLRSLE